MGMGERAGERSTKEQNQQQLAHDASLRREG
jgi:hypothetical protein